MRGLGSGGTTAAGCGYVATPCGSTSGSYSWVSTQLSIPLPPHHRARSLSIASGTGPASCVDLARSSPQLTIYSLRQPLHGQQTPYLARDYTGQALDWLGDPVIPRSQARSAVCRNAARAPQAATQAAVSGAQAPLAPQPAPDDGNVVVDLGLDLSLSPQQPGQRDVQQGPTLLPLAAPIPPIDTATAAVSTATTPGLPGLPSFAVRDPASPVNGPGSAASPQPGLVGHSPRGCFHNGSPGSPPQGFQEGASAFGGSNRPSATRGQLPSRPQGSGAAELPREPRGSTQKPGTPAASGGAGHAVKQARASVPPQQQQRAGQQQEGKEARQSAHPGAHSLPQQVVRPAAATKRDAKADDNLFHFILKSTHWRHIRSLLQYHQERYMEELRLARGAAAAATCAAAGSAASISQDQELAQQRSELAVLDDSWDPDSFSWTLQPVMTAAEADTAKPHQQLPQRHLPNNERLEQQQHPQQLTPPQPLPQFAFKARHLAAALHATAQLVPEPGSLGPSDRLQLGDFLRDLGRGCAALGPTGAFTPADLTMALRALARLLGAVRPAAPADDAHAVAAAAARQVYDSSPGEGRRASSAAAAGEEFGGVHFDGPRPRRAGHEQDVDEYADVEGAEVAGHEGDEGLLCDDGGQWPGSAAQGGGPGYAAGWGVESPGSSGDGHEVGNGGGGSAERGPHVDGPRQDGDAVAGGRPRPPSSRGLHAAWLDERWVEQLLAPTIQRHLQDFEPRHVAGVLWALATLGVRPRPEILGTLCDQAAQLARASLLPSPSSGAVGPVSAAASPPARGSAEMTAQGLSLTLWAVAKLGFQARQSTLDTLLAACAVDMRAAAAAAAATTGPQATARITNPSSTASGAEAAAAARADAVVVAAPCCSLDLAQRAWAVATLGCHPGAEWLDLLVRALLARGNVEQVSGQSCSMVMWALAKLHCREPARSSSGATAAAAAGKGADGVGGAPDATANGTGPEDGDDEAMRQEMLRARTESNAGASTSGRGAAGAVARIAAAPVGYLTPAPRMASELPDSEAELAAWIASVAGSADAPAAGAVRPAGTTAGWAGAAGTPTAPSQAGGAALPPDQVVALMALLRDALGRMSSQHLATVLWALSILDVRPSRPWLEAYLAATARRMSQALSDSRSPQPFGPQSLAMLLAALGRLRYRPPWQWMMHYLEVCRKELPRFSPHAACTLVWALTRLSYQPPGHWVAAFTAATQPLLPAMPPSGLCVMLWAVARWRVTPSFAWVRAAVAASAGQLRSGAETWERQAVALEAQAAASGASAVAAATNGGAGRKAPQAGRTGLSPSDAQELARLVRQPPGWELQPGLLACMVWGVSRLNNEWRAPGWWLSLAGSATQNLLRRSRAATLASGPASASGLASVAAATATVRATEGRSRTRPGDGGASASTAIASELDPRTVVMLLWGWARLRGPLPEGCLYDCLLYIADAAAAAAAGGDNTARRRGGAPMAAAATVAPQHIALGLWSCVVMGLVPPQEMMDRLVRLHSQLLLREDDGPENNVRMEATAAAMDTAASAGSAARQGSSAPAGGGDDVSAPRAMRAGAGVSGVHAVKRSPPPDTEPSMPAAQQQKEQRQEQGQHPLQLQQQRVVERLVGRQAEMGMLVWSLANCGAPSAPGWFPGVLALVGSVLERDATAAAATAATAGQSSFAEHGAGQLGQARRAPPLRPGPQQEQEQPLAQQQQREEPSLQVPSAAAPQAAQQQAQHNESPQSQAHSSISLLTVATLARACLLWRLYPGDRWVAAATTCLDAGLLGTSLRRMHGKVNLEAKVRYLLEELRAMRDAEGLGEGVSGARGGPGGRRGQEGAAAWTAAAEASGGGMLTNAVAAMAAGSAAAWMQGLVW